MKKFLILFLLFQIYFFAPAQNKHAIDSLQAFIKSTTEDSSKVMALVSLSKKYEGFDSGKAIEFGNKALLLAQSIDFKKGIGKSYNNLGDIYWYRGDFTSSSTHYFNALKIYETLNDLAGMAECYRNIGWVYQGQYNYELTEKYYKKSLELHQKLGLNRKIIMNFDDLGIVYKMMGKFPEAVEYGKSAIAMAKKYDSNKAVATCYGNLGATYYEMGNYKEAILSFETAKKFHKDIQDFYNMAEENLGLADCYIQLKDASKAIEYAAEGLDIAKRCGLNAAVSSAYLKLSRAYELKKDFTKAYSFLHLYTELQDSTYNEKNSQQINEMSAKYESDKKELMINSLAKDKELSDEKFQREKNFKIYLSIFCLMIVVIAFILFRGNVHKKKVNASLSHAYKEIEVKNKDITDSINYSKRIQEASLPPIELKYKLFPDAFILFKPKDIVSGDFYWYAEKNGKRLIAACDCTGHGVPGALMSMIGNNILNQLVNEKGITAADEILNNLHIEIRKALKQEEHQERGDGMDIALVVFNSETEIEYAGAQRPLWIISNDNNKPYNPIINEIKGNKFSIGGLQTEQHRIFNNTRLTLSKGDSIYFFSDGYVDQFGGEQGKKFMSKNFKELLLTIHTESMAMQETILSQSLEKWAQHHQQVDDILVIGIKI